MKQSNKAAKTKRRTLSHLFDNNWFVLVFSLIIAVILWCGVSIFQTTEVEKEFVNVKVQLNYDGSLPSNKNMKIFGEQEYYVDVTVKGKSYLVNDENFASKISASVSFSSVTSAGTYSLPINVSVDDPEVEVVNYSKSTISVFIDELLEKSFPLEDEIIELAGYSLPEGYARENPRLSVESVILQGPALEISRVSAVKAVVELDKELKKTETFTANLIFEGTSESASLTNITVKDEDPVYITIPVSYTATFKPVINFSNIPKALREEGISYTVSPETVTMMVSTGESENTDAKDIVVGTIDFADINNDNNTFRIPVDESQYTFTDGTKQFTVTVDMSSMHKRWLEIAVSTEGVKLPEGAALLTNSIQSVQVIGPAASVDPIDATEAYAVPQLDGVELKKGVNTVPAKVILRTLTDSWVRGEYTVQIRVGD